MLFCFPGGGRPLIKKCRFLIYGARGVMEQHSSNIFNIRRWEAKQFKKYLGAGTPTGLNKISKIIYGYLK